MKRLLVLVLLISLLGFSTPALAQVTTNDDLKGHIFEHDMRGLISRNIIFGYGEGIFGPNDDVTRAQFATFISRALNLPSASHPGFPDVPEGNVLKQHIERAAAAGIVSGYSEDGTFKPNDKITREQMASIVDRALAYKKVSRISAELSFVDTHEIHPIFKTAVSNNVFFGIIRGNTLKDGRTQFAPKQFATRGQAAAFINRMLTVIETTDSNVSTYFQTGTIQSNGTINRNFQLYMNYNQARNAITNPTNQVIYQGEKIVWIPTGSAGTVEATHQPYTTIYTSQQHGANLTYVVRGTQMEFLEAFENSIKVQVSGVTGFVKTSEVRLNPAPLVKGRSYYRVSGGELFHHIFLNGSYQHPYLMGRAPAFLNEGVNYFSNDGITFAGQEAHQYFNYLPIHTKTNYTAEQLNQYVIAHRPLSPLRDLGQTLKDVEQEYNINALVLLTIAIHESAWGLSPIAQDTKNLYSIRAYDSCPAECADRYETWDESVYEAAKFINSRYTLPTTWQYRGAILGNKALGMNVRYASDPYWGQKIAGHMYRADKFLGGLDTANAYQLGVINTEAGLNVRTNPNTSSPIIYSYPKTTGITVVIYEEIKVGNDTWYKIGADHPNHQFGYVYGNGTLGQYVRLINPIK